MAFFVVSCPTLESVEIEKKCKHFALRVWSISVVRM
jgi:hypothetical protein